MIFQAWKRSNSGLSSNHTIGSSAGFCSLTALRLIGVNITDEVVDNFISNCPLLEHLCVADSKYLVNLKIVGPSLKLKSLEIKRCMLLKNLEIAAINLVSCAYNGPDIGMPFRSVPLLSELSIGGKFASSFISGSHKHYSYIHQIEKLTIILSFTDPQDFPLVTSWELHNLKEAELSISGYADDSLRFYALLINVSPNLSKFTARLFLIPESEERWMAKKYIYEVSGIDLDATLELLGDTTTEHHQCLKVVELVGFDGGSCEIAFVLHLVEIAISLEKIIIDPCHALPPTLSERERVAPARERARQLRTILPATVELVIL